MSAPDPQAADPQPPETQSGHSVVPERAALSGRAVVTTILILVLCLGGFVLVMALRAGNR